MRTWLAGPRRIYHRIRGSAADQTFRDWRDRGGHGDACIGIGYSSCHDVIAFPARDKGIKENPGKTERGVARGGAGGWREGRLSLIHI